MRFKPVLLSVLFIIALGMMGLIIFLVSGSSLPEKISITELSPFPFGEQPQQPSQTTGSTHPSSLQTIVIPVRILMLQSSDSSVQTTLSDAEIENIFNNSLGVNEHYWKQAGIKFEIESIVKVAPGDVSHYASTINSGERSMYQTVIRALTPTTGLLAGGFNVVVVHDFGSMGGGIYLNNHIAYVPEKSVKGDSDVTRTFAFAHELGHPLSLPDLTATPDPYNILAISNPNVYSPQDKTHLTSGQIAAARAVAASGHPATISPTTGE